MSNFAFVSDFDGTLTEKDFYKMISDDYLGEEIKTMYKEWKDKKIKDVDYLGYIFKNIGRNEEEIYEDIMKISLDPYAKQFINNIIAAGGDFVVVSAGTSYYINKVFQKHGIKDVEIYSNEGEYRDKGLYFVLNENSEFYSEIYGIDKEKVVKKLKQKYDKIFYAGDSAPDIKPSLIADVAFAKNELVDFLKAENKEFIEFHNFSEIWQKVQTYLKEWK
ncbi:MAG: MtnX-like HAD-IB family phosphatase [Bacillota bacterium]|nr:MtnX-like HAD-IB family phosphatase [Bacillota bacterium]